jgi:hypothetical protein
MVSLITVKSCELCCGEQKSRPVLADRVILHGGEQMASLVGMAGGFGPKAKLQQLMTDNQRRFYVAWHGTDLVNQPH